VHVTNGVCDLRDNLWWNFATNGVARPLAETAEAGVFFSDTARNNLNVNPQLASISRTNLGGLDPRPLAGSPALTVTRTPPLDGFYLQVGYKGAFNENNLWLRDWTFLSQKGFLPPPSVNVVNITGPVTNATTWYATNEYVLNGFIYVLDGATLTIDPGTVVKAAPGQDANTSCLIVTRGGKIFANGTRTKPIIFTSESDDVNDLDDLPIFQRGLWGGIVLMGRSVLNTAVDTAGNTGSPKYDVFEGLPDSQVNGQFVNRFGGNDDNDSSGVMRYVSIRHSGVVFQPNKELNGLSLGAVGRGTVLEHIESYAIADDGFEFFGGTVNTRYLVSAFNDDDAFDADQGYRGKNQFWFAIQEPGRKDNGAELNGEPNGLAVNATPIGNFEIYNATWIGAGTNTTGNRGMIIREYAAPKIYNSVLTEFGGAGVNVDVRSAVHVTNGVCDLRDNLWWNFATNGVARPLAENAQADVFFSDTTRNNQNVNPMLRGISRAPNGGLDPRPMPGSPALTTLRVAPSDGFYCDAPYKGAFDSVNWATDWTALSDLCILSGAGGGVPMCMPGSSDPCTVQVTLVIVRNGANVEISFTGVAGANYRVQSTTDLSGNPINWTPEGSPLSGAGTLTYTTSLAGNQKFFRVVCQ